MRENLLITSAHFLWAVNCNSQWVAHVITGADKGIGESLYKMKSLIVNMELSNQNSLIPY